MFMIGIQKHKNGSAHFGNGRTFRLELFCEYCFIKNIAKIRLPMLNPLKSSINLHSGLFRIPLDYVELVKLCLIKFEFKVWISFELSWKYNDEEFL